MNRLYTLFRASWSTAALAAGILAAPGAVLAQMTGYTAELDTVFLPTASPDDPFAELEFFGMYSVYANFTDSSDVLGAVYSDVAALGTPAMGIDAPCGCFNPANTSPVVDGTNNPAFYGPFPEYEYDSFFTIGMTNSASGGQLPSHIGIPTDGASLCSGLTIDNGTVYITGSTGAWPTNAVAGADLKVLVARVTTCGDFSFQGCGQVYVGGQQSLVQNFCPDSALFVQHIFNDGECVNDADGDGVCDEFEVMGCDDAEACNYNVEATQDDGGCVYVTSDCDTCSGETDGTGVVVDNDADDDGVCDADEITGCTDELACNYDATPTTDTDNTLCIYPDGICDTCSGETDGTGVVVDNDADDDGVCDADEIDGCTDMAACNYLPEATDDDGTCFFPGESCDDGFDLTEGDVIQATCACQGYSCYDEAACNYSTDGIEDNTLCSYIAQYEISGNASPYSQTLQVYTYTGTAGSTYEWTVVGGDILEGNGTNEISIVWNVEGPGSVCVTETNAEGCSGEEECFVVDVTLSSIEEHLGGSLEVFPVPASGSLNVVWTGPTLDNAYVTLRDATGRVVAVQQVAQREVMEVSQWSAGTYTLEFTVPERGTINRRILIQ
jgi:hypothetical protein